MRDPVPGSAGSAGSLGTVRNAAVLLDLLAEGTAHQQLSDLADRAGLSLPTVHRLLRSLVLAGLVEQDPRTSRYGLGPELVRLAHRYLARLPLAGALAPYLGQLRDETGCTVRVEMLVHTSVVVIDRVDRVGGGLYREPHRVRTALSSPGGRLLAARADDLVWKQVLTDAEESLVALAETRRDEWAQASALCSSGDGVDTTAELAVPVIGGDRPGALVLELPPDPGPSGATDAGHGDHDHHDDHDRHDEHDAMVAHPALVARLLRAGSAAVRTLGHD